MARVLIPCYRSQPNGKVEIAAPVDGNSALGHYFPLVPGAKLYVRNGHATDPVQVTVASVADDIGRTGDIVQSVAAGETWKFGPFAAKGFMQSGADFGSVFVNLDVTKAGFVLWIEAD